ncbi:MAG TPA: bifunctional hydroxymethylpyrimidine kinase/phosphomethylpyrimidine kinase [Candidatus Nitrosocosmicus sp.]|nr:bifunctional hydroxymethylpyrimidine kinase/phosphomethylpyrimidine kinase [Candidatus Nitrosocosmicus sp.]
MKKALTIAGSDSSAGAGIQADLKTFSALGIYATTVITTLTAQNTKTVSDIFVVPAKFFKNQLETTVEDIKPDVIKIGVLYDNSIINIVKKELVNFEGPIVLDPVFYSGTGVRLLDDRSFVSFKRDIIPLATVITPNIKEAQLLSQIRINSSRDIPKVAEHIRNLGVENVIIKGGHSKNNDNEISDYYYGSSGDEIHKISNPRLPIDETHGTGCNFSSALASYIAMEYNPKDAFILANSYVHRALKNAIQVGGGVLVANPLYRVFSNSERYETMVALQNSVEQLERFEDFSLLIPETKTNFVFSVPNPYDLLDVAGVVGRITNYQNHVRSPNVIRFGASNHVANALLAAKRFNPAFRAAINIRYTKSILQICKDLFDSACYDRKLEPSNKKKKEGASIKWGIAEAFKINPSSEVVYHSGDLGKEPMILIFAETPLKILTKILAILKVYNGI